MGYTCCVPGCRTGHKTIHSELKTRRSKKTDRSELRPPLYQFPKDKEMQEKWIASIPRKNWTVTTDHRVCRRHFRLKDFDKFSSDSNQRRRKRRNTQKLARLRLKDSAVPSIFRDVPSSSDEEEPVKRLEKTRTSVQPEKDKVAENETKSHLLQYDSIKDLVSLKEIMQEKTLPDGYIMSDKGDSLQFYYLEISEDLSFPPKLSASVIVKKDFEIGVFIKSTAVPWRVYSHLLRSHCLQTAFELANILSLAKTLSHQELLSSDDTVHLDMAISNLQKYVRCEMNGTGSNEESHISLIKFIIEQLSLTQHPRHNRRYSADLIFQSFAWKLTSTSCYKELQDLFLLPCVTQLRNLSTAMTVESCRQALEYLRERGANVSDSELEDITMDNEKDSD